MGDLLEFFGLVALVAAAFTVGVGLGLAAAGVALIVAGLAFDGVDLPRPHIPRRRRRS